MTRFVVVSGLPASGKTTLGRALAAAWALPFIDKDEILEALFEREGTGGRGSTGGTSGIGGTRDAPWRQRLSQAADAAFARQAQASGGAVLASCGGTRCRVWPRARPPSGCAACRAARWSVDADRKLTHLWR